VWTHRKRQGRPQKEKQTLSKSSTEETWKTEEKKNVETKEGRGGSLSKQGLIETMVAPRFPSTVTLFFRKSSLVLGGSGGLNRSSWGGRLELDVEGVEGPGKKENAMLPTGGGERQYARMRGGNASPVGDFKKTKQRENKKKKKLRGL